MALKIVYIANHNSGGNCDEEAVAHALEQLGHEVVRVLEHRGSSVTQAVGVDLFLFHKWYDLVTLGKLRGVAPRAFWYWDLVDFPDLSLKRRNDTRKFWMNKICTYADFGFCTDGDWVDAYNARQRERGPGGLKELHWLPQGADERVLGRGTESMEEEAPLPPILFTGIRNGGRTRADFVDMMQVNYRQSFNHVSRGVHGRELADLIARSKIVVAPDGPVTGRYWSNRIYLMLGFGAFLLHPYCAGLANHYYTGDKELVFYRDRTELKDKIAYYLDRGEERRAIADAGLERTLREHTYRHRLEQLLRTVEEGK
jgi:hypothetical protein